MSNSGISLTHSPLYQHAISCTRDTSSIVGQMLLYHMILHLQAYDSQSSKIVFLRDPTGQIYQHGVCKLFCMTCQNEDKVDIILQVFFFICILHAVQTEPTRCVKSKELQVSLGRILAVNIN